MIYAICLLLASGASRQEPAALKYLNSALDLIEHNSVKKGTDWAEMRRIALKEAAGAKSPADTYPAIFKALEFLGDKHSGLFPPQSAHSALTGSSKSIGVAVLEGYVIRVAKGGPAEKAGLKPGMKIESVNGHELDKTSPVFQVESTANVIATDRSGKARTFRVEPVEESAPTLPTGRVVHGKYGYVEVPGFSGTQEMATDYATSLQKILRKLDASSNLRGWLIDIRANTGGNMWPMIAGLGPFFPDGEVGAFQYSSGSQPWFYGSGDALIGRQVLAHSNLAYELRHKTLPIVVLTEKYTASSGEAVLIAFKGMQNVKFVGAPSYGVPTANNPFPLEDGAILNLCVAVDADRTGKSYDSRIAPDVEAVTDWGRWGTEDDPVLRIAEDLIDKQR